VLDAASRFDPTRTQAGLEPRVAQLSFDPLFV
jgi:hypothetical protein